MSEHTTPMPTPTDDETLVAYLDGELSREETLRFEQNLHTEPGLQKRVNDMQASWSLLSELPCPSPRRDLTQSTIEMVTLAIRRLSVRRWSKPGMKGAPASSPHSIRTRCAISTLTPRRSA